jgi:hypothetical protein
MTTGGRGTRARPAAAVENLVALADGFDVPRALAWAEGAARSGSRARPGGGRAARW